MKYLKKLTALILSAAAVLSVAGGCKKDDDKPDDNGDKIGITASRTQSIDFSSTLGLFCGDSVGGNGNGKICGGTTD